MSGLSAAVTAGKNTCDSHKIVLLEADDDVGGRVRSDVIDGYICDRGFAVFIEQYPSVKALLDYNGLQLRPFLPGALVKVSGSTQLARVSDPFRQPLSVVDALLAPVGSLADKIKVLPLLFDTVSKTPEALFAEEEMTTMDALKNKWGFGNDMISKFYTPFLEGIYLAPLEKQSSRMFHFVFKMFSEGSATLPTGGIGAVSEQLKQEAINNGVHVRVGQAVSKLQKTEEGMFVIETTNAGSDDDDDDNKSASVLHAKNVVLATDGRVAQSFLSQLDGFAGADTTATSSSSDSPSTLQEEQPQQAVGCLYYALDTETPPVMDPILILNGDPSTRGTPDHPINNLCFPSVVNPSYAPAGKHLCSVTVLRPVMEQYLGKEADLDKAVRKQLSDWFPSANVSNWKLLTTYYIPNAQPGQLDGPSPANVYGGRDCTTYRGKALPDGLAVCGDHMATATLNGAVESGVNAGNNYVAKV